MSTTSRKKKPVRDIQRRTGWAYTVCLHAVRAVGYDSVSNLIDDLGEKPEKDKLDVLREELCKIYEESKKEGQVP